MADKQMIIDGVDVSGCECFYTNDSHPERKECINPYCKGLCKDNPNCYFKQLARKEQELKNICKAFDIEYAIDEETGNLIGRCNKLYKKEQECEELKKKLKPKLKNAHCAYFDGQTGWCKAKEFIRCNPIGCKLYTIDELSTIVDLQQQLDQLKAEKEEIKKYLGISSKTIMGRLEELQEFRDNDKDKLYQAEQKLERIREIFDFIEPNYVWYNGKKSYIGDDLIEFLKTNILQIIDEVRNAKKD